MINAHVQMYAYTWVIFKRSTCSYYGIEYLTGTCILCTEFSINIQCSGHLHKNIYCCASVKISCRVYTRVPICIHTMFGRLESQLTTAVTFIYSNRSAFSGCFSAARWRSVWEVWVRNGSLASVGMAVRSCTALCWINTALFSLSLHF